MDLDYEINKQKLENISYFKDKEKNFLSHIGNLLKPVNFSKGEVIFYQDEPAEEMYFIKKGSVSIYSNNDAEIYKFNKGNYFGEWDFFFNNYIRKYKCIANSNCTFFTLLKNDFDNIYFRKFFNERQLILSNSFKRYKLLKDKSKIAVRGKFSIRVSKFTVLSTKQENLLLRAANSFIENKKKKVKFDLNLSKLNLKIIKLQKILNQHFNIINNDFLKDYDYKTYDDKNIQTNNKFSYNKFPSFN